MGIYKKSGKYYARIQYHGVRRHFLCVGCKEEREAEIYVSNELTKLVKVVEGLAVDERNEIKLRELTKVFLAYSKTNKKDYIRRHS